MLVIRDRQLRALAMARLPGWIERHLRECFPEDCEALGARGLREEVRYGLGRAASYGFTRPVHLSQYLDLMFTFGRDFDKDTSLAWPEEVLTQHAALDPEARMERLIRAATQWLEARAAQEEGV